MASSPYSPTVVIVLLCSIVLAASQTVTIGSSDRYNQLSNCAKSCFEDASPSSCNLLIAGALGCGKCDSQIQDSCFCQSEHQQLAATYLSGCVNSACASSFPDVSSAMDAYNYYCQSTGGSITILRPSTISGPPQGSSPIVTVIPVTSTVSISAVTVTQTQVMVGQTATPSSTISTGGQGSIVVMIKSAKVAYVSLLVSITVWIIV